MKSSFTIRDFSLSVTETFKQKEVLLIVRDSSELPPPFDNEILKSTLDASVPSDTKYLVVEWMYAGVERLGILRVQPNSPIAHQVAEAARNFEGSTSIYTWKSLDIDEVIFGFAMGTYRFCAYITEKKELPNYELVQSSRQPSPETLTKIQSIYLARDLVNMPPNDKNPLKLSRIIQALPWKNTQVRAISADELDKKGFWMLLAVAKGSDVPASVIILERNIVSGRPPDASVLGKGVTFDAGGLQIKPDKGMLDMKTDMAGAAATIAAFWYLDQCNSSTSAVGAVGLVENLLWGSAFKPLDIVRAQNGLTVEIHHTDAEWRLVLGDLAAYISEFYMPKTMVSIATLTWACIHALGYDYAGVISVDEILLKSIQSAAARTHESVWNLPLDEFMLKGTHAKIADRKNLSSEHMAGASMGAAFIAQFVKPSIKYAHLDIAGPSYRAKPRGIFPAEGTGFGTEILIEYILSSK